MLVWWPCVSVRPWWFKALKAFVEILISPQLIENPDLLSKKTKLSSSAFLTPGYVGVCSRWAEKCIKSTYGYLLAGGIESNCYTNSMFIFFKSLYMVNYNICNTIILDVLKNLGSISFNSYTKTQHVVSFYKLFGKPWTSKNL